MKTIQATTDHVATVLGAPRLPSNTGPTIPAPARFDICRDCDAEIPRDDDFCDDCDVELDDGEGPDELGLVSMVRDRGRAR